MKNPKVFFDSVRVSLFAGRLTQPQVDGLNALTAYWAAHYADQDARWLAYALATARHETAGTMRPVSETGHGKGHPYGVPDPETGQIYYGRGYVQLTWRANYKRQGKKLGLDLENMPDIALVPSRAAAILFGGMIDGDFTGAQLCHFFNNEEDDPVNARRIVNGLDCADVIAFYYEHFLGAIQAAV